jgi:uncharacterized protein (TIGR02453 family)
MRAVFACLRAARSVRLRSVNFEGFPASGVDFFQQLAEHNNQEWFEAHRKVWDDEVAPAMLAWSSELARRLQDAMPGLQFVARVGGSLHRLNRDLRFTKDKRPYRTSTAALLWDPVGEKHDSPGFYFSVAPGEVVFSGGMWMFEEARLDRYRKRLQNEAASARLDAALDGAKQAGLKIDALEKLSKPPRGFSPEHPRAELSKLKGLTVAQTLKPGPWLLTREALEKSEAAARAYAPLHAWLRDELCR